LIYIKWRKNLVRRLPTLFPLGSRRQKVSSLWAQTAPVDRLLLMLLLLHGMKEGEKERASEPP
jgi:hypothetical protein